MSPGTSDSIAKALDPEVTLVAGTGGGHAGVGGWFHGGVRGLEPGALLLPPVVTGAPSMADYLPAGPDASLIRRDRVYIARRVEDALVYAGLQLGGGDLYEVEPVGELEPDGDYKGNDGYSVQTVAARVVRVVRRGVTPDASLAKMRAFVAELEAEGAPNTNETRDASARPWRADDPGAAPDRRRH
ncbi:MAG: hypothetical protein ABI927_06390 [Gaiellaceae bacterium]